MAFRLVNIVSSVVQILEMEGKTVLRIFALIAALTALAACETTKGVGRDVENAGQAMDEAI